MSASKSFVSRAGWMGAGAMLTLGCALMVGHVRQAIGADEKPKAAAPAAASVKLVKPWSDLTTLSDDQKGKISEVHQKALAQMSEIRKQEKADIMALLTDAQKTELKDLAAKEKKDDAAKAAAKKAGGATDKPATPAPEKKPCPRRA